MAEGRQRPHCVCLGNRDERFAVLGPVRSHWKGLGTVWHGPVSGVVQCAVWKDFSGVMGRMICESRAISTGNTQ